MVGYEALKMPKVRDGALHSYYVHACLWNEQCIDIHRNKFIGAVKAELPHFDLREKEGVKLATGYVKPLYLLPMFQKRIAIGSGGFPLLNSPQDYIEGLCPVAEDLYYNKLVTHEFIVPSMSYKDIDDVVNAFEKVWDLRKDL